MRQNAKKEPGIGMTPIPFQQLQQRFNDEYYRIRTRGETPQDRVGFPTPSHTGSYAHINAKEFAKYAMESPGRLEIHEFGAAEGTQAKNFMDWLRENAAAVYGRTAYWAWDKSEAFLDKIAEIGKQHPNFRFGIADVTALDTRFAFDSADYVFCHELFDDLAARVVWKLDGQLYELGFVQRCMGIATGLEATRLRLDKDIPDYEDIAKAMGPVSDRFRMTFPIGACRAMRAAHALLKANGRLRVFDYGFGSMDEFLALRQAAINNGALGRNELLVNGYSMIGADYDGAFQSQLGTGVQQLMQATTLVNFIFLADYAKRLGFDVLLEKHLEWASRICGEPQTCAAHFSQGIAYGLDITPGESAAQMVLTAHRMYSDPKLMRAICNIADRCGDSREALKTLKSNLGSAFPQRIFAAKHVAEGESLLGKSLEYSLSRWLDESGVVDRIRKKSTNTNLDMELVPGSSEQRFRDRFKPEIELLVANGFDPGELMWRLFATPSEYRVSGSSTRLSLTAAKK